MVRSSIDFEECYPPVSHTPYWTIIIGFITSVLITYVTYSSGHGLFSLFKSCVRCKCCSNKKTNMNKRNGWTKYPKIIHITSANAFKSKINAARFYGNYLLKSNNNEVPYYTSAAATSQNGKFYYLTYLEQDYPHYYKGWVMIVDKEKHYKYDLIQCNALHPNDDNAASQNLTVNQPLLIEHSQDTVHNDSEEYNETPLSLLDKKRVKCKVYVLEEIDLESGFFESHISHSKFMWQRSPLIVHLDGCGQIRPKHETYNHWLRVDGFRKYYHTVWNYQVLDINGKYVLDEIQDSWEAGKKYVVFKLKHEENEDLNLAFDFYKLDGLPKHDMGDYRWEISIDHTTLGTLAKINVYHKHKESTTTQRVFSDGTEIVLKIEDNDGFCYYFGKLVEIIFFLMAVYALVYDFIYFVAYYKKGGTSWQNYECYLYIISNSANMKQLWVFGLCSFLNGESFVARRNTLIAKGLFMIMSFYFGFVMPFMLTHLTPFIIIYIWVIFGFMCIAIPYSEASKHSKDKCQVMSVLVMLLAYFVMMLWPVACMSRFYHGDGYMYSFYSVYEDRKTFHYIENYISEYKYFTQLFLWLI